MKQKRIINGLVLVLCVLVVLASITNVLPDNEAVLAMAGRVACGGKDKCDLYKTSVLRLPIWQVVTFTNGKQTVEVRCTRSLIAVGEYSCKVVP